MTDAISPRGKISDNSIAKSYVVGQEIRNNSRLGHAQSRGLELLHFGVTVKVLGLALSQPSQYCPSSAAFGERGHGGALVGDEARGLCDALVTRENSTHDGREGYSTTSDREVIEEDEGEERLTNRASGSGGGSVV